MYKNYEIGKLYEDISANGMLKDALKAYILCVLQKGLDKVHRDDIGSADEMIEKRIISENNGFLKIENSAAVAVGLYIHFKSDQNFIEGKEFEVYHELHSQIVKSLKKEYSEVYEDVTRLILSLMIHLFFLQGGAIKSYIRQLEALEKGTKKRKRLYEFANAYASIL